MTVTANSRTRNYEGNGVTTVFNGPMAFSKSQVWAFILANGVMTKQPSSAYNVEKFGAEGGTRVTMNTAPAVNEELILRRMMVFSQDVDITNQGAFLPETIEKALDVLEMQLQQVSEDSLQLIFDNGEFVWDAKGNRIANVGDAVGLTDAVNMRSALTLIEQVQNGGGVVGVQPKKWDILSDDDDTIDFALPGADVDNTLLYLVYVGDKLLEPNDEFQILPGDTASDRVLRIPAGVDNGMGGFVVLVGYARPWTGDQPITTVAPTIITDVTSIIAGTPVDGTFQNTLILINSPTPVTVFIRKNTGSAIQDWGDAEGFSVAQLGVGQVTLAIAGGGGAIVPSPGFSAKTRGLGSVISGTCHAPDSDAWLASGDLERIAATPELVVLPIYDRSALNTTNITTGTGKGQFVMPFGMVLETIANRGCYASLLVAQTAGVVLTVDVNRNGTSIISTKLTFDNNEKTTLTAATPAVYASGGDVLAAGDEITIDVDQVGTALAKGLIVYLVGRRAS